MVDIETEMAQIVLDRLNEQREQMIATLVAAGYKVTKPRTKKPKAEGPALNAVGKPFSPSYDPNYRTKYKGSRAHLSLPQRIGPVRGWTYTNKDVDGKPLYR